MVALKDAQHFHAIPPLTAHFAQPHPDGLALLSAGAARFPVRAPRARGHLDDSGNEPPLEIGTPHAATLTRRVLNLRWVLASVLTGVAGATLLGAAIYVSSEGEVTFAEPAERASLNPGRGNAEGPGTNAARKGDKLVRSEMTASAKQLFRAPMTLRSGDREVIKLRSFVRLATGLSLTSGVYSSGIPAFNPLRFFSDPGADRIQPEAQAETSDAEVSVVKTDLSILSVDANAPTLSDADIVNQLREEARLRAEAGRRTAIPLPGSMMLSRMLGPRPAPELPPESGALFPGASETPFRSLDIRVVPENVTSTTKTAARSPELGFTERTIAMPRGEALEAILRTSGAGPDEARSIVVTLGRDKAVAQEGQQLRVLLAPTRPGETRRIARAILMSERGIEAIAALNDRGSFVSVTPPQAEARTAPGQAAGADDDEDDDEGTGAPLYESLYETLLKHEIPRQTVEDLVRIFGYDVDFQRRVAPGDSIELFAAADEEGGADRIELLSASLKLGSEVRRVFRYQGEDGSVDYFDEAGRSLKKFLLRKPIVEARLTSGFGSRYHPILGYSKMHSGIDWANKIGTPILASGNGTIAKAAWDSGYGRRVEIQHANGYMTTYNHMSAFGRGIAPGTRVRQGQVIGYVGTTGLSTGPHLHYEVVVNGHFVDPLKIRVPRGRELEGRAQIEFSRQREQIEQIRIKASSGNQLAQSEPR